MDKIRKWYPRSLGVGIYTRRELAAKYRTRRSGDELRLYSRETGTLVARARLYTCRRGQTVA